MTPCQFQMRQWADQFTVWGVDLARDLEGTAPPEGRLSVEIEFQDGKWPFHSYTGFLVGEGDSLVKINGNREVSDYCAL